MNSSSPPPLACSIGLLLGRIPMGLTFLLAGIGKFRGGVGEFVNKASGMVPSFLPLAVGRGYLHAVPVFEVLVGTLLILGLLTRLTGAVASLMLISFIWGATGLTQQGGYLHFNVVFLGLTLLLMLCGGGEISLDRLMRRAADAQGT